MTSAMQSRIIRQANTYAASDNIMHGTTHGVKGIDSGKVRHTLPQADCGLSSMSGVRSALIPWASSSALPQVQLAQAFLVAPMLQSPTAAQHS